MSTILFADSVSTDELAPLVAAGHECLVEPGLVGADLAARLDGVDVLVVRSTPVTADLIAGSQLQLVVRAGAGVDTIDLDAASRRGVFVCNVPGRNAVAVAELTMGLLLAVDRRLADSTADARNGVWNKGLYSKADGLLGKQLAIVGLGSIGLEVARRAKAFGLVVAAVAKDGRSERMNQRIRNLGIRLYDSLDGLLAESDVVSIHVPGGDATRHLVDGDFLSQLRNGAILLNTSRGDVVDEAALLAALDDGLRAGLDVFADEPSGKSGEFHSRVAAHANVVASHHIGASTEQAQRSVAEGTVTTIRRFLDGAPINVVNLDRGPTGLACISVTHLDRVGVLAAVFGAIRQAGVNVQQMQNQLFSGDDGAAIATIHLGSDPTEELLTEIRSIDDVVHVQVLATP